MPKQNYLKLSGLEPLVFTPTINFVNIGERTNVTAVSYTHLRAHET
jgi:5-methyltetrahydrofolate--homocysteine methyltransferase